MGWGVLSKALFRIEIYEYMLDVGIWLVKQSKRKEIEGEPYPVKMHTIVV